MKVLGLVTAAATAASCATHCSGSFLADAYYLVSDTFNSLFGNDQVAPPKKFTSINAPGVEVVDFSTPGLPKIRMGGRVMDLVHGLHFDDILQDTPDELRPPAVVAFYDSNDAACMKRYNSWRWDELAENTLPPRERLFVSRYDMYSAPRRAWYKFVPELDLAKRFKVKSCPELVFVPRSCNGFLEWCVREEKDGIQYMGCENFKDHCSTFVNWDGKGNMKDWIMKKVESEEPPRISKFLRTYKEQGIWLQRRDHTSSDNHLRNLYLSEAFPGFTKTGFKAVPIPKDFNEWLLEFYNSNQNSRRTEFWDSESSQMSFVEIPTDFVDLDRVRFQKEEYANKYIKPIVEEWSGVKPLELTSFYGIREYPDGSFLKNHVDRIDTHVLSVTFTVDKLDADKAQSHPWPLEVIQWSGDHVRYTHPAGTMVLYESSKLPHGRPYRNRGGTHAGAFLHFKPVNMHGSDAKKWDEIAQRARSNQARHTQHYFYKSTPSVEPEVPVYSSIDYGQKTKWRHATEGGDENSNGSFTATFTNKSNRMLDLFWESHDGAVVHQGTLAPKTNVEINTYRGHKFFWAEKGSKSALPASRMTMEKGRSDYSYSLAQ